MPQTPSRWQTAPPRGWSASLVGKPFESLVGRTAEELGLADLLVVDAPATVALRDRMWELRRTPFREAGRAHTLVVLSDVSRALREEERQAWQRLVRVLSHEINNSLTPISSIAGSLRRSLARDPESWADEAKRGLDIIERRAEVLARFMTAYAELARLPRPELAPVDIPTFLRQAAQLDRRVTIRVVDGPPAAVLADADQLEQLLINILANAADAALETAGGVEVSWTVAGSKLRIEIRDEGRGIAETTNLFVPFFTTKPGGSGIGLALSRQIAEGHGGTLTLENRADRTGCVAALVLPVLPRSISGLAVPPVGSTPSGSERSLAHDSGPPRAKGEVTP
jgi:two-component system, NtrC family, nitrogen regulation sensor histidine kinase NtrY